MYRQFHPQLNLDFTVRQKNQHVFFKPFDICHFYQDLPTDFVRITKGTKSYFYANIYEVIFWYTYYISKYHNITRRRRGTSRHGYQNRAYFSRIPPHYAQCSVKRGLIIVEEALEVILKRHNGIPEYWDPAVLTTLFEVKSNQE